MALTVATNTGALMAQAAASSVNKDMEQAMNRLSTGNRINTAADDAAGVAIASRMTAEIKGLNQAIRNAADGQSMADTAEGAMIEIESMLQRMRELSVQSASDTLSANDRETLQNEVAQLQSEIDRIVDTTSYNGINLLDGTANIDLQIGSSANQQMNFKVGNVGTSQLGTALTSNALTASTSVTAEGSAAVENVVNMTFNGNDSYGFKIELDGNTANKTLTFTGEEMAASDASDIADAITAAIAANANTKGLATATASGNTVSLTTLDGSSVKIHDFTSTGNGSVTVNPITNSGADSVTLEDTNEASTLVNSGGVAATASTATLQLEENGKAFSFKINGTLVEVATSDSTQANVDAIAASIKSAIEATSDGTATVTADISANNIMQFSMSDDSGARIDMSAFQKITSSAIPAGFMTVDLDVGTASTPVVIEDGEFITSDQQTGTGLAIADGKTATVNFSNQNLKYTFSGTFDGTNNVAYSIDGKDADFMTELSRVATEITNAGTGISAVNNAGVLEISNTTGGAISFKGDTAATSPGVAAVDEGDAYFLADAPDDNDISDHASKQTLADGSTGQSTDGVLATASEMFLTFEGDDRYSFTVDGDGAGGGAVTADIVGDVSSGSLSGLINSINAQSTTTSVTAREQGGQIVLKKDDGTSFSIKTFSSENTGKITAVNAGGQGGSAVLQGAGDGDEVVIGSGGSSDTAAKATATTMEMLVSGADKFSFKISDGSSIATIRASDTVVTAGTSNSTIDHNDDVADLKAEIDRALTAANMDHITASSTNGTITLTNALGTKVEITDFRSDGSETMTATPGSGQGVGTILDDDALDSAQSAVSAIDITTAAGATLGMDTIDRALESLVLERANLGSVVNRLDHTISNLTNVSANTAEARGRIMDADFAAETTALSKAQILQQASTAMLAQANASKQNVLSLLQG